MAHSQYEINVRTQPVMCLQLTDQKTKLNSIIIFFFFYKVERWYVLYCTEKLNDIGHSLRGFVSFFN